VRRFFRWTPIVTLGGMCYSIYLWHFFVMRAAWPVWVEIAAPEATAGHLVLFVSLASAGTLALSVVMFVLVERPTMEAQWPRRFAAAIKRAMGVAKRCDAASVAS